MSKSYPACDAYVDATERDWVDYEFATIVYDYQINSEAVRRIEILFNRLKKKDNT